MRLEAIDRLFSCSLASLLMLGSFFASAVLFTGSLGFGLCSYQYGSWVAEAPSSKEAAPFAAPFLLFSSLSAASFALSLSAVGDGLVCRSARRSSRRS